MERIKIESVEPHNVKCKVFKYQGCSRRGDRGLFRAAAEWSGGPDMKDAMILSTEYGHDNESNGTLITYIRIYYN